MPMLLLLSLGCTGSAWAVRWSEDGKTLVTGGKNPSVAVWTLQYE